MNLVSQLSRQREDGQHLLDARGQRSEWAESAREHRQAAATEAVHFVGCHRLPSECPGEGTVKSTPLDSELDDEDVFHQVIGEGGPLE